MARDRDYDDRDDDRDDDRRDRRSRDDDRDNKKRSNPKTEVRLERVRLSYPALFRPKSYEGNDEGNAKYSASFIIDPDTPEGKKAIAACEDAIDEAKFEKWGNKQPRIGDDKIALRDDKGEDTDNPEYEGMWYVSASNARRPKVLDRDGRSPLTDEDGVVYGGCYVNAIVRFWAQDNKYGKRVNASLEGVQFVKDGEAFGAPPLADDAFDPVEDEGGDDRRGRRDGGRRSRDDDDDRGSSSRSRGRIRDRDRDDDRGSRGRDRDREDDRGSRSRDREDSRDRDRDRDRDEDRSGSRGRSGRDEDRDDDRDGRRRGRSSRDLV